MAAFLDIFLFALHSAFIVFNLFGWLWRKTRRLHLAVILLTCLSWFGLGVFYGFGYCPFTDWHWDIKRQLGETDLPPSFVKYYVDRLTGIDWDPYLVDMSVLVLGLAALGLSLWVNWRDRSVRLTAHKEYPRVP